MATGYKALDIALAEDGYVEKASNKNLDNKTANPGSGNYTKYARDLDKISGFYNGPKNGYPWCDVFVDWCFVQAYGVQNAMKVLFQPKNSAGAGVEFSANYYKAVKRFYKTPKVGDQIFFQDSNGPSHTGLVYKTTSRTVYTVEGNTSGVSGVVDNGGMVCLKSYSLANAAIYGYGRPDYSIVGEPSSNVSANVPVTNKEPVKTGGFDVATLKTLSRGYQGSQVTAMQILLIGRGYSCGKYGADGDFGPATEKAVIKYQKSYALDPDGICGPLTWASLLGA